MKTNYSNLEQVYATMAKLVARRMKLGRTPAVKVKAKARCGHAHPRKGYFTLPGWLANRHGAYQLAYVIHELSHFKRGTDGDTRHGFWLFRRHGPEMRRLESEIAEKFNLRLVYRGPAYVESIRNLETGLDLCGPYGRDCIGVVSTPAPLCTITLCPPPA